MGGSGLADGKVTVGMILVTPWGERREVVAVWSGREISIDYPLYYRVREDLPNVMVGPFRRTRV